MASNKEESKSLNKVTATLLALLAVAVVGCTAGTPKAVVPQTRHDFGDVPVVADMSKVRVKEFVIKNEGSGNLKLSDIQVKTLEGC